MASRVASSRLRFWFGMWSCARASAADAREVSALTSEVMSRCFRMVSMSPRT